MSDSDKWVIEYDLLAFYVEIFVYYWIISKINIEWFKFKYFRNYSVTLRFFNIYIQIIHIIEIYITNSTFSNLALP